MSTAASPSPSAANTNRKVVKKVTRKGKKEEEPIVVVPPPKTEEELLAEQVAATLLDIPTVPQVHPLHSPTDILWTISLAEILTFCFPPQVQHPLSRGRLCILAAQGPLVRRHTYMCCLCTKCQTAVKERRKEDEYCRRVFNGELFTEANIPKRIPKKQPDLASTLTINPSQPFTNPGGLLTTASAVSFAYGGDTYAPTPKFQPTSPVPALDIPSTGATPLAPLTATAVTATATNLNGTISEFPVNSVASPGSTMRSTLSGVSDTTATFRNTINLNAQSTVSSVPLLRSPLHNAVTPELPLHPEYDNHTVDQLDFLCSHCRGHIRSQAHIFGGVGGKHVLGDLQLNERARRIEEEDLLRAYNRWQIGLKPEEERDFINKLDGHKLARARLNYTKEQIGIILENVPRLNPSASPPALTDRMDFYAVQSAILAERATRIQRLSEMYPDAASKGDKGLQASAITLKPLKVRGNSKKYDAPEGEEKEQVNGVSWKGESILTTAMLHRQYPPHQSYALRSRLLHKHTHNVVELGPNVNNVSVQLTVQLMRNEHASDRAEGWKTHF